MTDPVEGPVVEVRDHQILVNGQPAGSTVPIEQADRLQRIDEEFTVLKGIRERWKVAHPGQDFSGQLTLRLPPETPALVLKSVFMTAVFAGYPNLGFMVERLPRPGEPRSGVARLPVDAPVPRPPPPARPPPVKGLREGTIAVAGRLPPEVVLHVVRPQLGGVRLCYEQGLRRTPTLRGRITVEFVIGASGSVESAKAVDSATTLPDRTVVDCVVRAFSRASFPQPESGTVSVRVPVELEPDD